MGPRWVSTCRRCCPLTGEAFSTEIADEDWRVLALPITGVRREVVGWVQAVRSLRPVEDALTALATQLYIILPLAVLIAAVLSYFLAGRALRPLTRIAHTAEQIGPNTLGKRISYDGPADEVGAMATAFDSMLDRVQDAFERERRFSADASHELRTPLAAIKSGIGVSLARRADGGGEPSDTGEPGRAGGPADPAVRRPAGAGPRRPPALGRERDSWT